MSPGRNDSARGQAVIKCLPYELWRPQIYGLHNQGWTILDFLGAHSYPMPLGFPYPTLLDAVQYGHLNGPLSNSSKLPTNGYMAITKLFKDSKTFFALESDYKMSYNKGDSEAGYTKINGEKEFLTIRDPSSELSTPAEVRASAAEAWKQMYELMHETLAGLEVSLKLQPGSLQRYCENARSLGHADGSSMIRIFRYENDTEFKVLAEGMCLLPHELHLNFSNNQSILAEFDLANHFHSPSRSGNLVSCDWRQAWSRSLRQDKQPIYPRGDHL